MGSSNVKPDKEDVSEVQIETFTYNWKIKNFKFLHKKPGEFVQSPVFTFGSKNKIDWQLELYPSGTEEENKNFLSLYLSWKHSSIIRGWYKLSLIDYRQNKQQEKMGQLEGKLTEDKAIGFPRIIHKNDLNEFLTNDCLTIHCEIALFSNEVNPIIEKTKRKLEVSSGPIWLKKLFLDERLSDIKLIAVSCGQSLPAHRTLLAACSPVFEAMFSHDMLEQKLGEVKIEDSEYEIIKEMLRFIYLGEVEDLKSNVFELVKLAHKYQITELIQFCETALINEISVDNVLKLTTLADSYNMEQLKTLALDFGSLHLKEIVKSNDFKSSEYTQAIQSILEKFGEK